jgi:hypothetical protein
MEDERQPRAAARASDNRGSRGHRPSNGDEADELAEYA